MSIQPITYSLILNLATLGAAAVLSWVLASPLLFVIAIILATHALSRFQDDEDDDEIPRDARPEPEYEGGGAGFTADISKR